MSEKDSAADSNLSEWFGNEYDDGNENVSGEIRLWRAVIAQAVIDAKAKSQRKKVAKERRRAKQWLFSNSSEFKGICLAAGYSAQKTSLKARKASLRGFRRYDSSEKFSLSFEAQEFKPFAGNPFGNLNRTSIKSLKKR